MLIVITSTESGVEISRINSIKKFGYGFDLGIFD